MKVLIIDNYDSYTYNLYQYIGEILAEKGSIFTLDVARNDAIDTKTIVKKNYSKIVISPGPGSPDNPEYFGVCANVLTEIGKEIPVLGVCLGMQGMAHCFGGKVVRAKLPMHGKTSAVIHDQQGIFQKTPQHALVMRYHSLVADPHSLPDDLLVTALTYHDVPTPNPKDTTDFLGLAKTGNHEIMGLRHRKYPIEGIQFHPESFATEGGKDMLRIFLRA
jgi:anthranilate synthase component II